MSKPYRKNVGIVIFNSKGEVLVGERINIKGSWQFPQGGIDEGEDLLTAAKREIYEEVGIQNPEFVYEYPDWLNYDFPSNLDIPKAKKYKGQTQKWFLFYWDNPAANCILDVHEREFAKVKFIEIQEVLKSVAPFKLKVYKQIIAKFEPIIQEYLKNIYNKNVFGKED